MVENSPGAIRRALECWTRGRYILTAAHEQKRTGVFVESAQPVGMDPPLICVAARKGHPIGPMIRDTRHFGLCELTDADKVMLRKFAFDGWDRGDPFELFEIVRSRRGCPLLKKAAIALECEVFLHLDLERECELYIGEVTAVRMPPA